MGPTSSNVVEPQDCEAGQGPGSLATDRRLSLYVDCGLWVCQVCADVPMLQVSHGRLFHEASLLFEMRSRVKILRPKELKKEKKKDASDLEGHGDTRAN